MNTDKLKLFKSEEEVKHYARVNGYDEKDAKKMLNDWNNLSTEDSKKSKKKKIKPIKLNWVLMTKEFYFQANLYRCLQNDSTGTDSTDSLGCFS